MSQYLQPFTAFFIVLVLAITLIFIGGDLFFAYSSDLCLSHPIFFQSISLGHWLYISGLLNITCLGLLVYSIKKNHIELMKVCTKIIMVAYDCTSMIFLIALMYSFLYSKTYCSENLSKYMLVRIGGSMITILNGYFCIRKKKYSS